MCWVCAKKRKKYVAMLDRLAPFKVNRGSKEGNTQKYKTPSLTVEKRGVIFFSSLYTLDEQEPGTAAVSLNEKEQPIGNVDAQKEKWKKKLGPPCSREARKNKGQYCHQLLVSMSNWSTSLCINELTNYEHRLFWESRERELEERGKKEFLAGTHTHTQRIWRLADVDATNFDKYFFLF